MPAELLVRHEGPVAHLTLNRPERAHAIDRELARQLEEAWHAVRRDPSVRVVILTATGSRHFCVGVDLHYVASRGEVPSKQRMDSPQPPWTPMASEVWKPVICVVNGVAAGAGLHLVNQADIVVAEPSAAFMDTHVNVGMVGAIENVELLDRLPLGAVLLMTLVGREHRMTAARAHQLGLVDVLAEQGQGVGEAERLAGLIARNSPSAVSASKRAIWHAVRMDRERRLELGWRLVREQWQHPDFREGAAAFTERRHPVWTEDAEPEGGVP
jgi:E-phenylitaconyl-CoA hydratase